MVALERGGNPEAQIAHHQLAQARAEAAGTAAEKARERKEAHRAEVELAKLEKLHAALLDAKRLAYLKIQSLTEELASAVTFALEIEGESRATHLRLDLPAGRSASAMIEDFVGHQLNVAGLRAFPLGLGPSSRAPLVSE